MQEAGLSADEIDLTPEDRGEGSDEPLLPSMQAALDGAFDLGTEEGRTDAVGALVDDGVSKESAESIIHRLAADDVVGAKEAYDRELTLNPSLRENARLVPDEDSERPYRGLRNEAAPVGTTFGDNGDLKSGGCTLEKAAEVIKQMESSGRYGISTPAGRGRVVHGAYQMMTDNVVKWSCEIGKCANPAQFLRNPALQDEVFRHKFGQYWRQFGSASAASQAWLGGPGSVGKYGRSDRFGTTVGSYAAKFARLCGDPSFRPSRNDYTLHGGDPYYGSLTGQNSPFANTNPLVSPQPAQQFPQQQQPPRPPVTPVSQQIRPPGTQTGVSGSLPPAPVQPEASILVQPKELARGNPLTIVWSSVGVSTVDPCRVSLESGGSTSLIARANNGSRTITTTATSTPGTWRFLLQCSISGGRFLERSASTLVK
ncbi:hypothetical protein HY414_01305 [Candidatus Kaiserbacteria bacterium]|nr:hypothetical protein [Candidatus Kaiserbacteria bacterium]